MKSKAGLSGAARSKPPPVAKLHSSCPAWGQGAFWKTPAEAVVGRPQLWKAWVLKIQVLSWNRTAGGEGCHCCLGSICSVPMQLSLRGKEEKTPPPPGILKCPADPADRLAGYWAEVSLAVDFTRLGANLLP